MNEFKGMSDTPFFRGMWQIIKSYFWESESRKYALTSYFTLIVFELVFVYLLVLLNKWNVDFYNALQDLDKAKFFSSIKEWLVIVFILISVFVTKMYLNLKFQLNWREWMTSQYLDKWLDNQTFYGIKVTGHESDNPDQRISEDINSFTSLTMTLTIGLLGALVTFFSFITILWGLSGELKFTLFGTEFVIHGYLVWCSLIYSLSSTWLLHYIGKRLALLDFHKEKREANFRFSLMRIREYSDSIAFYSSSIYEKSNLKKRFDLIVSNTKQIILKMIQISTFRNLYVNFGNIFPIIVVAPRMFAGEIKFGELMQTASAFGRIDDALSWVIDNYASIANYRAITARLTSFKKSIDSWEESKKNSALSITYSSSSNIELKNVDLALPNGEDLIKIKNHIFKGNTLISAPSGTGKSTLMRAIAGIWPFGEGKISIPSNKSTMFISQKSYMPQGSFMEILNYPSTNIDSDESFVRSLIKEAKLEKFEAKLEEIDEWSRILSGGEQQKIAFIRAILKKPDIIFLDEATSAMDEANEELMYSLLKKYLPESQVISIGHRSTLKKFHANSLVLSS